LDRSDGNGTANSLAFCSIFGENYIEKKNEKLSCIASKNLKVSKSRDFVEI
jgi:hypothetical protein